MLLSPMCTARNVNLQTSGKTEVCLLDTTAHKTLNRFFFRSPIDRWPGLIVGRFFLGPTGVHGSAQTLKRAIGILDSELSPFLSVHNLLSKSLLLPLLFFRCCRCYLLLFFVVVVSITKIALCCYY